MCMTSGGLRQFNTIEFFFCLLVVFVILVHSVAQYEDNLNSVLYRDALIVYFIGVAHWSVLVHASH